MGGEVKENIFIKTKALNNNKGQALFEMILFLPFLMFLYTIYYTAGNSISASINQQKVVRGYYYHLLKGNSYLNTLPDLNALSGNALKRIGFNAVGWRDHSVNNKTSMAPCFKFSSLLKNGSTEECESDARDEESSSRFIRVFTFYGVCGPSYIKHATDFGDFYDIVPSAQGDISTGCFLGL